MCHQRQDVDEQEHRGAGGREQHERSGHAGDGVDDRRQQYQRRGHQDGAGRHLAIGHLTELVQHRVRRHLGQLVQVAASRVQQRVQRGRCGGDHHEEHQGGRPVQPGILEHHDERGGEGAVLVRLERGPRHDAHDGHERAHVEDEHAHDDLVDGFGQHLTRILGLGDGDAHELEQLIGEEHHLEAHEEGHPAVRGKREAGEQVVESGVAGRAHVVHAVNLHGWVMVADHDHDHGGGDHRANQRDLDHREPEFHLAEHLDGNQVDGDQRHQETQLDQPFPMGQVDAERVEEGDEVRGDGRDLGHAQQHERGPIRPAGEMPPPVAKVTGDEIDEGVLAGVTVHHFADGAHQEEHDDTDQNVHEDDRGAG